MAQDSGDESAVDVFVARHPHIRNIDPLIISYHIRLNVSSFYSLITFGSIISSSYFFPYKGHSFSIYIKYVTDPY